MVDGGDGVDGTDLGVDVLPVLCWLGRGAASETGEVDGPPGLPLRLLPPGLHLGPVAVRLCDAVRLVLRKVELFSHF